MCVSIVDDELNLLHARPTMSDMNAIDLLADQLVRAFEQARAPVTTLSVPVPRGALYGAQPPLYPRTGTYCFPSGTLFDSARGLATALGWPLRRVRSRTPAQQQQQQWRCQCCNMIISVRIGPFLTTVTVSVVPKVFRLTHQLTGARWTWR